MRRPALPSSSKAEGELAAAVALPEEGVPALLEEEGVPAGVALLLLRVAADVLPCDARVTDQKVVQRRHR